MPKEMIDELTLIFVLFILMIARTTWLLIKEKGGKPISKSGIRRNFKGMYKVW